MGRIRHFGEQGVGDRRSFPSRKTKKTQADQKPKQPQRGLGVAQLEKIILQNQKDSTGTCSHGASSSFCSGNAPRPLFGDHHHTMMAFMATDRRGITYAESSANSIPRSFVPETLPLLDRNLQNKWPEKLQFAGSLSQNMASSNSQELDLDLKLSL